ncbi:MAG TPA: cupin domain-containing protein [Chloroflexota bacterium]|nr:cupin domain-containing protein [Chloroflexota bacterium]
MSELTPEPGTTDQVQIFDVREALTHQDHLHGRVDMATSPNSYIAVFRTPPRGGETHVHSHPDSDQILFVLEGECTVEGLDGRYTLSQNQGVLIPAGVNYGFTNTTDRDLIFLSMRTESTGGRRVAYVPNVPSDVAVKIPVALIGAKGIGTHVYAYAMDRHTIGISPLLTEDWNKGSLLRMNCIYEKAGDDHIVAFLPERIARWYRLSDLHDGDYSLLPDPDNTRVRVDLTPLIQREASC